jgi:23S rRNA-/tRNA-specific pseudouridylate synthase
MSKEDFKGFRHGVRTLVCKNATSLSEIVASQLNHEKELGPLSALDLIEMGSVYVNEQRSMNSTQLVKPGDQLRIHTSPRRFPCPPELLSRIVSETQDTLLIEKPVGLPTEATADNARENLIAFLEEARGQRLFLTHRIASESEGLVLIAKNSAAQARVTQAFAEGKIERLYVAYTEGPVRKGEHLPSETLSLNVLSCDEQIGATSLISENRKTWHVSGRPVSSYYRIELQFTLARPREIREYLARSGAAILGDRAFGSRYELTDSESGKASYAFQVKELKLS